MGHGSLRVTFANVVAPENEGAYEICARVTVAGADDPSNNTVCEDISVIDDDTSGPEIYDVIVSAHNGNGDDIITPTEEVRIEWQVMDPSGVGNVEFMLNGEYDIVFPLETSQKPMFELLGTDPEHKKHYVTSAGHLVPRDVLIRETLDWFDRYLRGQGY